MQLKTLIVINRIRINKKQKQHFSLQKQVNLRTIFACQFHILLKPLSSANCSDTVLYPVPSLVNIT